MKLLRIFCLIGFTFNLSLAKAQTFLDPYQKDISISFGTLTAVGEKEEFEFVNFFYRAFAPTLHANVLLSKSNKQGVSFGLDLAQFWNVSDDTITTLSTNNDFFFKAYDIDGRVQVGSIGASWVRFFGQNEKCTPFIKTGGELMLKRRTIFRGSAISSEFEGEEDLFFPVINEFSFNGRIGIGLKHQLSERVKIFEEVSGSYMLFKRLDWSQEKNWSFAPLGIDQYFLLNMSVGITFSLDQE
jgi:hypothetical protein